MLADQRPHALPAVQGGTLLDPIFGPLGGAAERPEGGAFGRKLDRIVLPQAGRDHAPVQIDDALKFSAFESDLDGGFVLMGKRRDRAHQARSLFLASPWTLSRSSIICWILARSCSTSHCSTSSFCAPLARSSSQGVP